MSEAGAGREDAQAIFELRALAGNRRRSLRQAEAHLTRLQPALLELAAEVRASRFGEIASSEDPPFTSEETQQLVKRASGLEELRSRLATLVGPSCGHEDPPLGSQRALDVANAHLLRTIS